MNILITGARGTNGSYIASRLSKSHNIFTPSSTELDYRDTVQVDHWFDTHEVDIVVHCAISGRNNLHSYSPEYLSDGLVMFNNLWRNRNKFSRLIHLGSGYEYGHDIDVRMMPEDSVTDFLPTISYGYAKNVIARIIRDTPEFYNLRLFGVCYEHEDPARFFKKIIHQPKITITNDQYIDYLYLPDIMPMIECIIEGEARHRDINMVYPTKYRLSDLAYTVCDNLGLPRDKITVMGYNGNDFTGDSTRLGSYQFKHTGVIEGLRRYKIW